MNNGVQNGHTKEYLIPVKLSDGMFSTEYAIEIKLASGAIVSLFADKGLISKKGSLDCLSVILINKNIEHNTDLVLLPTETFETASKWVEVPST